MPHALAIVPNQIKESADLIEAIERAGFTVSVASTVLAARQITGRLTPAVVFIDANLLDAGALNLLQDKPWPATTSVILVGSSSSEQLIAQAKQLGAKDFLTYPLSHDYISALYAEIKEAKKKKIPQSLKMETYGCLVGKSAAMQHLYQHLDKVSPTSATVFVIGPSGAGKELVAKTIHEKSARAQGPYVAINCGAISKDLIGSALFGHEKGSFTGALQSHQGYFEQASGGTLFLDEITETSADLQVRLLRVLETGTVIPVGGKRQINIDVRVIAATNRDPQEAVKAGILREDLYYRLNMFPLKLPALQERLDDIPLLADYFLNQLNAENQRNVTFTSEALAVLQQHTWPGNVRELKNIVHRAYILAKDSIDSEHIMIDQPLSSGIAAAELKLPIGTTLEAAQEMFARAVFQHYNGNMQEAAESLQVTVKQLEALLQKKRFEKTALKVLKRNRLTAEKCI